MTKSNLFIFWFAAYESIVSTSLAATNTLTSLELFEDGLIVVGLFKM